MNERDNKMKRRVTPKPSQGFTLLELLLYIAIVGSLLIAITGFYAMVGESRIKNQSISEVNQQGAAAMDMITQAVRNANTIVTPSAGATSDFLSLTMPVAGVSPTLFDLTGDYGTMRITEGAGAAIELTNNKVEINGLTFKNLSRSGTPGVVQISFTVSRSSTSSRNEFSYQKTFTSTAALR